MRILALLAALLTSCGGGGSSAPIILDHPGQIVTVPGDSASFTLEFRDFVRCVKNGHAGVMLHANLAGNPIGAGLAFGRFGNTTYVTRNIPNLEPVAVLETWSGIEGYDSLFAQSVIPITDGPHEVAISSTPEGLSFTWDGVPYTVKDANPNVDYSLKQVAFFLASAEAVCPYSIVITPVTS